MGLWSFGVWGCYVCCRHVGGVLRAFRECGRHQSALDIKQRNIQNNLFHLYIHRCTLLPSSHYRELHSFPHGMFSPRITSYRCSQAHSLLAPTKHHETRSRRKIPAIHPRAHKAHPQPAVQHHKTPLSSSFNINSKFRTGSVALILTFHISTSRGRVPFSFLGRAKPKTTSLEPTFKRRLRPAAILARITTPFTFQCAHFSRPQLQHIFTTT